MICNNLFALRVVPEHLKIDLIKAPVTQHGPFEWDIMILKLLYWTRQVSENFLLILLRRAREIFISNSKLFNVVCVGS